MIHIKETEIIPFLKTAQTGYTKMISEGDLEMEVELAEKVEEALTQAMDIIYDYQSMADEHKRMGRKIRDRSTSNKERYGLLLLPCLRKENLPKSYALPLVRKETGVVKMTDREKKELIEAEETILQLFFDAYERAMKYTKGNINLSLRMAAMLVSAMVHDQTESKSFQFLWQMGRDNK